MTQDQGALAPIHCPRCGGLMRKQAGSTLYWHVDNNHPRCTITNIVETALEIAQEEPPAPPADPPAGRGKPKKR